MKQLCNVSPDGRGSIHRVYIEKFNSESSPVETISNALRWINAESIIVPGARVFIKPNLTWRTPTPGVTVTPVFLRALVESLLPYAPNLMIGESEGGQACFQAEEAFESHGLYLLEKEYGVRVINLSKYSHEPISANIAGKKINVSLPSLLLHEVDVFISVPVPKIHAMTGVSLGFKNQWGCLGDKMRVNQHPKFNAAICAINKILNPRICIFDGTYFLNRTGPMMGEKTKMNLVIAGNDVGAASLACCEIMGIDPLSVGHHRTAQKAGMFPKSRDEIYFNENPSRFSGARFRLKRAFINYIHLLAFHSTILNRLFYDSLFADGLHEMLWFVRRNPFVKHFLYGKYGAGDANRGGSVR
jgi:uncharacterized protein (DUF362 family)